MNPPPPQLRLNLLFFRSGRWMAWGRSSAVAHLWYLHGQLYEFSCFLTGATAVTVQLQLVVAAVLLLLISLAGRLDVPVRGEAAAHGPLTRARQEDHHLVETAVKAGENQSCAVICWQWRSKTKRRGSTLLRDSHFTCIILKEQGLPPASDWKESSEEKRPLLFLNLSEHMEKLDPVHSLPPQEWWEVGLLSSLSASCSEMVLSLRSPPTDLPPSFFLHGLPSTGLGTLPKGRQFVDAKTPPHRSVSVREDTFNKAGLNIHTHCKQAVCQGWWDLYNGGGLEPKKLGGGEIIDWRALIWI